MFVAILAVAMVVFLTWHNRQCDESLAALNAECDASNAFIEWRLRNQGVYIGLSEEGRMLLGRWLETYDWFLRTHKFIDGRERREWIVKMFYDFPPKYPDGIPSGNKGVRNDALSVLYKTKHKRLFTLYNTGSNSVGIDQCKTRSL